MKTPEEQREAVRSYMQRRGLTFAGWARQAGISSRTLPAFLAGRAQSLNHRTLQKLAEVTGDPIAVILGEMPDNFEEKNSILHSPDGGVDQPAPTLTEAEMKQIEEIAKSVAALAEQQRQQNAILRQILELLARQDS